MIRQINSIAALRNIRNVKDKLKLIFESNRFIGVLRNRIRAVPRSLKDQSQNLLRVWTHQCECVVAQRLRRGQQMFSLYSKLWEERALRDFMKQMRQRISARGKDLVIGALGITYDWPKNRITDDEMKKHKDEFSYIQKLKEATVCNKCDKNSRICTCDKSNNSRPKLSSFDDWKLFIEKNDLVVWRRLLKSGHYEYKVYGSYPDVSAEDFLNVQIDTNYRRQWDTTAVVLKLIEGDPEATSNGEIIYWEMLWPKLFANRDYVFMRRYLVDQHNKTLYLVSKSTEHPNCPKEKTKFRIEDYWSYMVIRPYNQLNVPGIEFSLTYYDNPGVNIPAQVTTWVAMKAMPDFLERLREASKKYKSYCQLQGVKCVCNVMDTPVEENVLTWEYIDEDLITDNTIYEASFKIKRSDDGKSTPTKTPPQEVKDPPASPPETSKESPPDTSGSNPPEKTSYWRRSFFYKLKNFFKKDTKKSIKTCG